ncbi:hypothetical protein SLA2020_175610 [Shorea laevis]
MLINSVFDNEADIGSSGKAYSGIRGTSDEEQAITLDCSWDRLQEHCDGSKQHRLFGSRENVPTARSTTMPSVPFSTN